MILVIELLFVALICATEIATYFYYKNSIKVALPPVSEKLDNSNSDERIDEALANFELKNLGDLDDELVR